MEKKKKHKPKTPNLGQSNNQSTYIYLNFKTIPQKVLFIYLFILLLLLFHFNKFFDVKKLVIFPPKKLVKFILGKKKIPVIMWHPEVEFDPHGSANTFCYPLHHKSSQFHPSKSSFNSHDQIFIHLQQASIYIIKIFIHVFDGITVIHIYPYIYIYSIDCHSFIHSHDHVCLQCKIYDNYVSQLVTIIHMGHVTLNVIYDQFIMLSIFIHGFVFVVLH